MKFISRVLPVALILVSAFAATAESPRGNDPVDAELERSLQEAERNITRRAITEGEFWGLRIGDSKQDVMAQLQSLGIDSLDPEVLNQIVVTKAKDLNLLADAEGVIWYPGYARLDFAGDQVIALRVGARLPYDWEPRLNLAQTRAEVFAIFAEILTKGKRVEIGNYPTGARSINPAALSEDDWTLLKKYDAWEFLYDKKEGYWNLRLEFATDRLKKINVWHSPVELP